LQHDNRQVGATDGREAAVVWLIYWPLLLVVAAAIVAGVAILVRRLRHGNDNPFIVDSPPESGAAPTDTEDVRKTE
jgi:hypothetical protein